MKLAIASALILAVCGNTSAFSAAPSVNGPSSALRATATETYTFTKSEEIFAEAKTVSSIHEIRIAPLQTIRRSYFTTGEYAQYFHGVAVTFHVHDGSERSETILLWYILLLESII